MPSPFTKRTRYPVRVFSVDPRYGPNPYTAGQLRQVVDNFDRYQKYQQIGFPSALVSYIPPADVGIGHDPDQLYARQLRGDLPNCGEPVRLWMEGSDLFAELDHVPPAVASDCEAGRLRDVSIELYPNYRTADGKFHGPILKRISLLGSTQPVLKGLRPALRNFVNSYSEPSRYGRAAQNVVAVFSEGVASMDRAQALGILQAAGMDTSALNDPATCADAILIAFANLVQSMKPPAGGTGTDPNAPVAMFSEIVNRAMQPLVLSVANMRQDFGAQLKKGVEQEIHTFSESNKKKLYPFERDAKSPHYIVPRLAKMDPQTRAAEMDVIANRPNLPDSFSEEIDQPDPNTGGTAAAVPANRVKALMAKTSTGRAVLASQAKQQAANARK